MPGHQKILPRPGKTDVQPFKVIAEIVFVIPSFRRIHYNN